jgi:hypothetical protein
MLAFSLTTPNSFKFQHFLQHFLSKGRMSQQKHLYKTLTCPTCKTKLQSHYTHDFRSCACGELSVDGGRNIERMLWSNNWSAEVCDRVWRSFTMEPKFNYEAKKLQPSTIDVESKQSPTPTATKSQPVTTQHYKLIWSKDQLIKFAEMFLTDLPDQKEMSILNDRTKIIQILAREKYLPDGGRFGTSNTRLHRELIRSSDPQAFVRTVMSYEVPVGRWAISATYQNSNVEVPVPQEALAMYVDLNSKSTLKAFTTQSENIHRVLQEIVLNGANPNNLIHLNKIASNFRSLVHSSNASNLYIDIDVDTKDKQFLVKFYQEILEPFKLCLVTIIETYNGFHVIFDKETLQREKLMQKLFRYLMLPEHKFKEKNRVGVEVSKTYVSNNKECQCPLPGTWQGGVFPVKMITLGEFISTCKETPKVPSTSTASSC